MAAVAVDLEGSRDVVAHQGLPGQGALGAARDALGATGAGDGTDGSDGGRDDAVSRSADAARSGLDGTVPVVPDDGPAVLPTPTPVPTPVPAAPVVDPGSGLLGTDVAPDLGGTLDVVPGEQPAPGPGTVRTVRVEVERGLPVDAAVVAQAVMTTLNDPRGWSSTDGVTFARTGGDAELRVVLASPATTDRLCAPLDTGGVYSCGRGGVAALNFDRWVHGAPDFGDDVATYRQYLVNHEVGHLLGHPHTSCPAPGALAPVMVQQSMTTQGCLPNGWPSP